MIVTPNHRMSLAGLVVAALLAACGPSHESATWIQGQRPRGPFTLAIVSGDNQTGRAVQSLVSAVASQTSPTTWAINYPAGVAGPLPQPLVVEVHDKDGQLADGVLVYFQSELDAQTGYPNVLGLGTTSTNLENPFYPATHGRAGIDATPYFPGVGHVFCSVDPSAGNSNLVTFTVTGQ